MERHAYHRKTLKSVRNKKEIVIGDKAKHAHHHIEAQSWHRAGHPQACRPLSAVQPPPLHRPRAGGIDIGIRCFFYTLHCSRLPRSLQPENAFAAFYATSAVGDCRVRRKAVNCILSNYADLHAVDEEGAILTDVLHYLSEAEEGTHKPADVGLC